MGRSLVRWWTGRSLRLRLTAAAGLVIALGLTGAAVLLAAWLHAGLIRQLDQTAVQRAQVVASALTPGRPSGPLPGSEDGETAIQVVDNAGSVRASSANLEGERRLFSFTPSGLGEPRAHTVHGLPLGQEGTWRTVALTAGRGHGTLTVYVAVPTANVDRSLARLTTGLAVGVPVAVTLLTTVGWLLLGRALRPVDLLRAQAAEITASDPSRRLDVPPAHDELGRLARTLNDLLGRLDAAARQQRQFVADAAHELRSPISSLRAQLDVAIRHSRSTRWAALAPELSAETRRLSRLVDNLVQLARLDAHPTYRHDTLDLDDIVFTEVRRARPEAPHMTIDQSTVGAARVRGDADALARAVRNLLDNAARHARGRIDIRLRVRDGVAEMTVADDGPGIPAPDRDRVFDRFTRLDTARTRDAGGSGLGLAIVHDVITAHGGTVHIEDNSPGARLVVHIPVAD
ncbi:two-component sensor histidine kinase [Streptomyces glebosus]|uniref:histidine kinase n=1 Tax=Streptomyces glebosus TaxID=249580 RepID=A0A640SP50_9ACTN|nr:ATP-binding protein [Streptomyces glebosus]GFE13263.1 two-component sensor histidine kinase [Streptomyces glebosus]GHG66725.1 two-component sensor histidine kinase [Streptomyces glebosus]